AGRMPETIILLAHFGCYRSITGIRERAGPEIVTLGTVEHRCDLQLVVRRNTTHPKSAGVDRLWAAEILGLRHFVARSAYAALGPFVATVLDHRPHVVEIQLCDL